MCEFVYAKICLSIVNWISIKAANLVANYSNWPSGSAMRNH